MERRLSAILAADVVGYSRLMEIDEVDTLAVLKAHREDLIDPAIAEHHGRVVKLMGDGALVEVASVVDAMTCALALNSNSSTGLADLGVRMVMAGEVDRGIKPMEKAVALNPDHPGWYHVPFFVYYYQQDSFEKALTEAQKINLPGWFWTHMLRAAAYGQLGREKDGRDAVAKLLELYPDFPDKARGEFEKWNNPKDFIEKMMDGLGKVGLPNKSY